VKLLFDQNISHRVVLALQPSIPSARHVRDFNLQFSTDREIWRYAKENDFCIVTFDSLTSTILQHFTGILRKSFGSALEIL
jgi:predicted nuclease of predicted toxin-antitoxin system